MNGQLSKVIDAAINRRTVIPDAHQSGLTLRLISFETATPAHVEKYKKFFAEVREQCGVDLIVIGGGYGCHNLITHVRPESGKDETEIAFLPNDEKFRSIALKYNIPLAILEDLVEDLYVRHDLRALGRPQPIDYAILTALQNPEFTALRKRLQMISGNNEEKVRDPTITFYSYKFLGTDGVANHVVSTHLSKAGNVQAAVASAQLLQHFAPRCFFFVGIAGALGQECGIKIGDVVVGDQIYCYDSRKKVAKREEQFAPNVLHTDRELLARANELLIETEFMQAWSADLVLESSTGRQVPSAVVGDIATGEAVVDSVKYAKKLRRLNRKLIAVETESGGALEAFSKLRPNSQGMVFRGISDYGDGTKSDVHQEYAATTSASFVVNFIKAFSHQRQQERCEDPAQAESSGVGSR